ncbi:MAG: prepilin-type N-terminal cleavage/methylation domain-containing protein [Opitutaceae bacterium]|jgi:type II secretory pathway pseudopilin PulG|nr:prepilin-type N-terminal cleavage/methylation domain-containing protein [Opitutaceae bacterium]
MTTTTPKPTAVREPRTLRGGLKRAFTLVEVMVSAGLSGLVMIAVLTAFLFITRASIAMRNYTDMETEARNAMETFAQDVRMSSGALWNSANSLTLTIEQGGATSTATYTYHITASGSIPARSFTRTTATTTDVLITNIRDFEFNAYSIDTAAIPLTSITAATSGATKQVQISLETERSNRSLALITNKVISARFVLRNKHVTT